MYNDICRGLQELKHTFLLYQHKSTFIKGREVMLIQEVTSKCHKNDRLGRIKLQNLCFMSHVSIPQYDVVFKYFSKYRFISIGDHSLTLMLKISHLPTHP